MEMSAPLINGMMFHSNSHQLDAASSHSHPALFIWQSHCPRFCNKMY